MIDLLKLILSVLISLIKALVEFEAEILVLPQQVSMLGRHMPKRPALTKMDRALIVSLYR